MQKIQSSGEFAGASFLSLSKRQAKSSCGGNARGTNAPTLGEFILAHFNPRMIGFGILGLTTLDTHVEDYPSDPSADNRTLGFANSEERK
jgi:hypothetical protein